jgi:hypothetical protein
MDICLCTSDAPTKPLNVTSEEKGKLAMQGRRLKSRRRSPCVRRSADLCRGTE